MEICEKIRILRKRKAYSQTELGELAGIKLRTVIYYESGQRIPKEENILKGLASALDTTVEFLTDDNQSIEYTNEELFIMKAREKYGSKGASDAKKTIEQVRGLMAGGELDNEDKEAFFIVMQDIYFDSKKRAKKYGRKKPE